MGAARISARTCDALLRGQAAHGRARFDVEGLLPLHVGALDLNRGENWADAFPGSTVDANGRFYGARGWEIFCHENDVPCDVEHILRALLCILRRVISCVHKLSGDKLPRKTSVEELGRVPARDRG